MLKRKKLSTVIKSCCVASLLLTTNLMAIEQVSECDFEVPAIIIDLDGNGIDYIRLSDSKVSFDVNKDGLYDNMSWPTAGNGVLFADWDSSGILDIREEFMFSIFSHHKHASDLEGLKLFDYEDDGDIDSADRIYDKLFVWDDNNQDGICSNDEVHSLMDLGITLHFSKDRKLKKEKHQSVKDNKIDHVFSYKASNLIHSGKKAEKGLAVSVRLKAILQ